MLSMARITLFPLAWSLQACYSDVENFIHLVKDSNLMELTGMVAKRWTKRDALFINSVLFSQDNKAVFKLPTKLNECEEAYL